MVCLHDNLNYAPDFHQAMSWPTMLITIKHYYCHLTFHRGNITASV